MAITYWPKHGETNTEATFAAYVDKLIGYADHASSDTAFMAKWTSNNGTNDTYTISAGSYVFNGYLFTAAGSETLSVVDHTSTNCYLSYIVTNATGAINECGVYPDASRPSAGAGETRYDLLLWNFNAQVITDYRQVFTWGRQSVASTDAGCVDFISTGETPLTAGNAAYADASTLKQFRAGYPGSVNLTVEVFATPVATTLGVYIKRGTTTTKFVDLTVAENIYEIESLSVTGLQSGDLVSVQGNAGGASYKAKNFRIRYTLGDITTAAVVVD